MNKKYNGKSKVREESESNKEAHEHVEGKVKVWMGCGWGLDGGKSATYPFKLHGLLNILRDIIELGRAIHLQLGGGAMSLDAS